MLSSLKVQVVQMTATDCLQDNLSFIEKAVEKVSGDVDIICFPENCTYIRIEETFSSQAYLDIDDQRLIKIHSLAKSKDLIVLLGGVPLKTPQGRFNATLWLGEGDSPQVMYKKIHLFDVDVGNQSVRESENYDPGSAAKIIEFKGWKLGFAICYDVRFVELFYQYYKQQVDVIFVPAAFLPKTGEAHWHTLLRSRAIEGQCFIVAAAQAGHHNSVSSEARRSSYGHSVVFDAWGSCLMDLKRGENISQVVSLNKELIHKVKSMIPMEKHRRGS